MFVYQAIYWTWLKLEMDESKLEKNGIFFSSNFAIIGDSQMLINRRRSGWSREEGPGAGGLPEMIACKGLIARIVLYQLRGSARYAV